MLVALCPAAGKGLKKLNTRRLENFVGFLTNPFLKPLESILSLVEITKLLRKHE